MIPQGMTGPDQFRVQVHVHGQWMTVTQIAGLEAVRHYVSRLPYQHRVVRRVAKGRWVPADLATDF